TARARACINWATASDRQRDRPASGRETSPNWYEPNSASPDVRKQRTCRNQPTLYGRLPQQPLALHHRGKLTLTCYSHHRTADGPRLGGITWSPVFMGAERLTGLRG